MEGVTDGWTPQGGIVSERSIRVSERVVQVFFPAGSDRPTAMALSPSSSSSVVIVVMVVVMRGLAASSPPNSFVHAVVRRIVSMQDAPKEAEADVKGSGSAGGAPGGDGGGGGNGVLAAGGAAVAAEAPPAPPQSGGTAAATPVGQSAEGAGPEGAARDDFVDLEALAEMLQAMTEGR